MGWESVVKTVNEKKATHTGPEKKQVNKSGWEGIVHTVNSRARYSLTDIHGKQYGPVSYSAVKAIKETTPANRKIYKYTPVNEQEKKILESYLDVMAPVLDNGANTEKSNTSAEKTNEKKSGFGEWLGKNAWAGLGQFNKGLFATLDFLLPTEFLGRYDFISNLNNYYHNASDKATEEAQKASASRGKGWKTAGDLVSGTTAALPNAILAVMTAGTSLGTSGLGAGIGAVSTSSSTAKLLGDSVKTMTKNPMYWTSFMQTLGTDYEEAKERGASDFVASSTAILTSALNAGIEIGGGIEQLPTNLKSGGKKTILKWAESMVDEGKEEVLQGITTNAMAKLMYDPKAPIFSTTDEKAVVNPMKGVKEFAAGAAVGGILGAGQIGTVKAVNSAQISRTGKFFNKPEIRQVVIDTGLESPKNTEAYKLANKINAKKGKVSDFELGKLYLANVEQINSENQMQTEVTERITTTPKTKQSFAGNVADLHNRTQLMSDRQNNAMTKEAAKKILSTTILSQRGKNISLEQAEDVIQSVTNRSRSRMENVISPDGKVTIDEAKMLDANLEFLSSPEQLIDIQYFRKYADTFAESLQARGSSEFQNMMKYTDDAAGDIANYALKRFVPSGYSSQAARALEIYGNGYKEILQDAGNSAYIAKLRLYKEAPLMSAQISALKEGDLNRVFSIAKDQRQREEIYRQYKSGDTIQLSDGTPVIQGEQGEVYAFGENAFRLADMTGIEPVSMLFGDELVPMLRVERSEIPAQVQERNQQESNVTLPQNQSVNYIHGDRYYKNSDSRKGNKIAKSDADGIMGVNEVHSAQQVNNGTEEVLNHAVKTQRMEENHGEREYQERKIVQRYEQARKKGKFGAENRLDNNQQSDAPRGGESHRAAETGISGEIQKQLSKTLYHGTNADIGSFVPSYVDMGIHFGTREQAQNRISNAEHPKFVAAKLNIKNPLYVREDIFGERTPQEYLDGLMEFAELTEEEKDSLYQYYNAYEENNIEELAYESLDNKIGDKTKNIVWNADNDGIYTTLSLIDESGQDHPIPRMEMISYAEAMQVLDAEDTIALIRRQKISAQGEEQLRRLAVDKLTSIEADYLRLRNLEKAIQSLGYDGLVYPNDNEGAGLSFAVFDNEQIEKVDNNKNDNKYLKGEINKKAWGKAKEQKKSIKSIPEIVRYISETFDIPISTGNISQREALGIYKQKARTIRTRIADALPVISHEFGHFLDQKYGFSESKYLDEIVKNADKSFLALYSKKEQPGEAVAEFMREYLVDPKKIRKKCPNFTSEFVEALEKGGDLKDLETVVSFVSEYMSAEFSDKVDAAIANRQKNNTTDIKNWFDDIRRRVYTDIVDSFAPQKDMMQYVEELTGEAAKGQKNAFVLATNSRNADQIANYILLHGMTDLDGNVGIGKSFIDCIKDIAPKDLPAFDRYLVLRHALEWLEPKNGKVKRVFADDSLQDTEKIREEIAKMDNDFPKMREAAENLYEFQRNIMKNFLVDSGGMSNDFMKYLNEIYPYYVPFYRDVKSGISKVKGSFANQRLPLSRAKGGGESILSPLESIVHNTNKFVKFALRNRVMQVWAEYADNIDGFGKIIEQVPPDMMPRSVNVLAEKKKAEELLSKTFDVDDVLSISEIMDEVFGDSVTGFSPIADARKHIVSVLRDGKMSYYQIHDDLLYRSLSELAPGQLHPILRFSQLVMTPMKILTTSLNPLFSGSNAMRDFQTAYYNSNTNNPLKFAYDYVKAIKQILDKSEDYHRYMALGGGHASELSANRDMMKKALREIALKDKGKATRFVKALWNPIQLVAEFNDIIEQVPRFSEFLNEIHMTGDVQNAIYKADDITTNFKRSGKTGRALNAVIMYNNAAVQGLDRMIRSFKDAEPKEAFKRALKYLLSGIITTAMLAWWNHRNDKQGYENLSAYMKDNFYPVSIGNGKFLKIPKAREHGILSSVIERAVDYAFGDEEAFYEFGGYMAQMLLPPMLPNSYEDIPDMIHSVAGSTIVGPFIDIGFNKDFKGTPIVSGTYEDTVDEKQYNGRTSMTAYWLGQILHQSPLEIDHVISGSTGILGQINKSLLPMNSTERDWTLGMRSRFIADSSYSTDVLNKIYNRREETNYEYQLNPTVENALKNEKYASAASYITKMNHLIQKLPEEKQAQERLALLEIIKDMNMNISSLDKQIINAIGENEGEWDFIVTSLPTPVLSYTKNKKKYTYELSPSEYSDYITDIEKGIEAEREKMMRSSKFRSASPEEKSALLKNSRSEVFSDMKEKYIKKYMKR